MTVSHLGSQSGTLPALARCAQPVLGHDRDYDGLVDLVGDRRFVLIGESTHGSREFYRERARITQRLVTECGFNVVALEADWPDAARVQRYTLGDSDDTSADEALSDFRRFPAWMWRNTEMVGFVEWLRAHNTSRRHDAERVRMFGLDLYSLRGRRLPRHGRPGGGPPGTRALQLFRPRGRRGPGLRLRARLRRRRSL